MEKTLVLIKPDAFLGQHTGDILKIYEENGLRIAAMKVLKMDEHLAALHYEEHIGRPYYADLVSFMTSGPIVAMVLEGEDAIKRVREINGKTDPKEAAEGTVAVREQGSDGTIRRLFAASKSRNAVHASDSPASAAREIKNFFSSIEIFDETYDVKNS